jgi:hypothetical protein
MLPKAQYPSGSTERKEAETGNDLGSAREIGAPFMLVEPIRNQAIPSRRGEVGASKISGSSTMFVHLGTALVRVYDIAIFLPLWIESTRHKADGDAKAARSKKQAEVVS